MLFDTANLMEYEANLFAADLLIDDTELLSLLTNTNNTIFNIAQELYVPVELVEFKLSILKSYGLCVNLQHIATADFLKKHIPENCISSQS